MTAALSHILCIDDEDDIREIARLSLESVGGFRVTDRPGGREGVDAALAEKPDLILIDVMMPGQDGPATLAELRTHKELDDVPVVFMTARVQEQEVAEYHALGAAGVIAKPFDPMALSEELQAIWADCKGREGA